MYSLAKKVTAFLATSVIACSLLVSCGKADKDQQSATDTKTKDAAFTQDITGARVLVFSKTSGWRHDSIPAGIAALEKLGTDHGFTVVATEDSSLFNDAELSTYNALVFLNTTLDVLNEDQEMAMERFIQAGGGFVGIHAAADTEWEGDWHWYRNLVGAVFRSHPGNPSNVQRAQLNVTAHQHPATEALPETFSMVDEWYDYRDLYPLKKDLLMLDESTYIGGLHGEYHPIAWYHDYDGGRSFYTGMGHTAEVFSNSRFLEHLLGGLKYAVGGKPTLDYSRARPEHNRFIKKTLVQSLNEPMGFDFFANGDALIAERPGSFKLVDYKTGETRDAGKIDVAYHGYMEWGLIGVGIPPDVAQSSWIYVGYNARKEDGSYWQRLARFKWQDSQIDASSEQLLLEYQIDETCCHTGGDIAFGNNGEVFFSTGDNTNPHEQNGYAPIDMREDRKHFDALRGAGNTQDLRGKILRIIPQDDGSYKIPAGNLFADGKEGRPEIYVMGARNPFTVTFDKDTETLYFGDVGPDASLPSDKQGTRAYDEVNRVTEAGNFGWPLIIGNNQPYLEYDYATEKSTGRLFNPLAPINNSPRNTGAKQLPPAQPALVWYPYTNSETFPEVGSGGRTALVADVYRSKDYPAGTNRYPEYYDNKLFILDFMRNWVKVVSFDEVGRIEKIEPFAPQISYTLPIAARFAPDGSLYVLEYGTAWFTGNPDSGLARIEYVGPGNRPPSPVITLDVAQGATPLATTASAAESVDLDGDTLSFNWTSEMVGNSATQQALGDGETVSLNFTDAGSYLVKLTATDSHGSSSTAEAQVDVGNAPAEINIQLDGNTSFYWPGTRSVGYQIDITDKEDGKITAKEGDASHAMVQLNFGGMEEQANAAGHQTASANVVGKDLVEANACTACHQIDAPSVGPSFTSVAKRYQDDPEGLAYLVKKIADGGAGAWGETAMPSFAHLNEEDRTALATYVLSHAQSAQDSLPLSGKLALRDHKLTQDIFNRTTDLSGEERAMFRQAYTLSASYTDKGGDVIGPITVNKTLRLIVPRFLLPDLFTKTTAPDDFKLGSYYQLNTLTTDAGSDTWRVAPLGEFDLRSVKSIQLGRWITKNPTKWAYELRIDQPDGRVVAAGVGTETAIDTYGRDVLKLTESVGKHKLYLAVRAVDKANSELHLLDISFYQ